MTRAIPEGAHTVTPHLVVNDAAKAIEFYQKAFNARELHRMPGPDGKRIMHACIEIGNSRVFLVDDFPEFCGGKSMTPHALGGSCVAIHLYVENVDEIFQQALNSGATQLMPVEEMFWGDRYGLLLDPFGHRWSIATHVRDVHPEEMAAAAASAFG